MAVQALPAFSPEPGSRHRSTAGTAGMIGEQYIVSGSVPPILASPPVPSQGILGYNEGYKRDTLTIWGTRCAGDGWYFGEI